MAKTKGGPACPNCGTDEPLPISYGLPMPESLEACERGEIALGGCCLTLDDPEWQCRSCGHRYHSLWRLDSELRQLENIYYSYLDEVSKAQRALRKFSRTLPDVNPNDAEFRDYVYQQREAFIKLMTMTHALEEAYRALDEALMARL